MFKKNNYFFLVLLFTFFAFLSIFQNSIFAADYSYTGTVQTFTVPQWGQYRLEVWGAQGGADGGYAGANGGYASGYRYLTQGQVLYIYVGGMGYTSAGDGAGSSGCGWGGGYNGGGGAGRRGYSGGGGGASDMRLNGTSLYDRIIVAGGGGGSGAESTGRQPGYGGGLNGTNGYNSTTNGASQTGYGTSGYGNGQFGIGATHCDDGGGGGGGYFGGGAGNGDHYGGGGSGYIGGVSDGYTVNNAWTGNGYARITLVMADNVAPSHGAFQDANPRYANIASGGTFRVHTAGATDTGGSGVEGTYLWVNTPDYSTWNILSSQKMNYWYDAGSSWYDVPVTVEGGYQVHTNVRDNAGNWVWSGPVEWVYIDRTIPIIGAITGYRVLNTNSGTNEYVSVSNVSDSGSSGLASLQYAYFVPGASDWVYSGWLTNTASSYAVSIPITVEGTYNVAIRVQDNAGNISNVGGDEWKRTSFLIDRTAPSGGSISYSATTITSSTQSLSITVADGTDSSAGINTSSRQLLRQEAIYNNGTCGSYGNPYPVSYSGTYPNITTSNFDLNRCYKYFWRIADNANNNTFYSSSTAVTATKPNLALKDVSLGTVISINNLSFVKVTTTGLLVALEEHPFVTTTTFSYTGAAQTFTVPRSGWYQIEAWGAQGGDAGSFVGGGGGYSTGKIYLSKNDQLYIYIGGKASTFNGGGTGGLFGNVGGGATDVRLNNGSWNDTTSLSSRIMVAAGGGGAGNRGEGYGDGNGGAGGTLNGGMGQYVNVTVSYGSYPGYGGTQVSGGSIYPYNNTSGNTIPASSIGGFGYAGGSAYVGGGSGYYGGGGDAHAGGGGGSSFISGYGGVNAITSSSSLTATNNTIHYSGKYFLGGQMQAGVRGGNGQAKITYLGNSLSKVNNNLNNVRYIKDCVNGSTNDAGNHWVELQAIKNGINVAKNKIVTANHWVAPWGTGSLNTITDGDITTSQYSDGGTDGLTCITVDLGQTYDLDEIAVWHYYGDPRTYNNNVTYVSVNNSTWTTVISTNAVETANGKRVSAY